MTVIISKSKKQTQDFAKKIAKKIIAGKISRIVALIGDLGAGKTAFAQGFARALGIREKILSPTFVILKKFESAKIKDKQFYHIDCYRIAKPKEILDLGFKKIVADPKNIVLVEWADKIKKIIPKNSLIIKFEHLRKNKRKITLYEKSCFNRRQRHNL